MSIAITRQVSPAIQNCELTHLERVSIDYELACRQHEAYQQALAALGCQVISLTALPDLADSVFVEDVAIGLDELAVMTRPGAESRRPEVGLLAPHLAEYRELKYIQPPGTLEGGDVLRVGKTIYVGKSGRTNLSGIEQLREFATPHDYMVKVVNVRGCLHLKSAISQAAPGLLLVNPVWVNRRDFEGVDFIEIVPDEDYAANAVLVGGGLVYPASFPRTLERLERQGISLQVVDVSELQKAEGAVTCCSLILKDG